MPTTESYVGSPERDGSSGLWRVNLRDDYQKNFDYICELGMKIYDAIGCVIIANFTEVKVTLSQRGHPVHLTPEEKNAIVNTPRQADAPYREVLHFEASTMTRGNGEPLYRVTSPIVMPSGLTFGWMVLYTQSAEELSAKQKTVFEVLLRNMVSQLLQSRQVFEDAGASELQMLISEQNKDWIFVKDKEFRIVYANNAFLSLYPEDKRDKVIGYTTIEEYDEDAAEIFLKHDNIAFDKGFSKVVEELHLPGGGHAIVETEKRRFYDENNNAYILGVCRDITEREALITELQSVNEDLSSFTSVASHDLKSPLNAIRRLLAWIAEDCESLLPEEHVANIRLVVSRADRMHTLLDDLLDYAKIGRETVDRSEINLSNLASDITQLLDVPSEVSITAPDKVILMPVVPFKTVMLNLIGNAVKHNDKAHGIVAIECTETLRHYRIDVRDNGPGIDPQHSKRIFQLFQTLKPRDEVEGSGMGLSVVQKHVTSFGGTVDLLSDGKNGSTFRLLWPKLELNRVQKRSNDISG